MHCNFERHAHYILYASFMKDYHYDAENRIMLKIKSGLSDKKKGKWTINH